MRTGFLTFVVCSILVFPGFCQTATRAWKDRAEYKLYAQIDSETDVSTKLNLLLEWRRLYRASDFAPERQRLFLLAYDSKGRGDEAFAAASELLQSNPDEPNAMLLLCYWAPHLKAPPVGAAGLVKKVATQVLARLDQFIPERAARRDLGSLFDSIESGKPVATEQASGQARKEQRAKVELVARQALDWANTWQAAFPESR
jgi:hypothetical protein